MSRLPGITFLVALSRDPNAFFYKSSHTADFVVLKGLEMCVYFTEK